MKRLLLLILLGISAVTISEAQSVDSVARNEYAGHFERSLADVLREVERLFDVRFKTADVPVEGVIIPYADFRIRPYSLEETLQNIFIPLDYKWTLQKKNVYRIKPLEYYRRTPADGEKLLAWLHEKYHNKGEWEMRRAELLKGFRTYLGIDSLLSLCVSTPNVVKGKYRKYDGYRVRNFALETLPGLYVCGSIYMPTKRGRHPLIMMPAGHWAGARYNADMQYRYASLARAGAICVSFDLVGWGESEIQLGSESHTAALSQPLQCLWGMKILDWLLADCRDIDTARIGVCGGSGGGTLSVFLTMLDDRYTVAAPVMSFTSHFDGGCPCESGMGTTRAAGGTCNAEYAATFAPRPMLIVSDGGDWTASVPTLEYPFLQDIYGYYGAIDKVRNVHFPTERHQFTPTKRKAVYDFFVEVFALDVERCNESKVSIETPEQLQSFGAIQNFPSGALRSFEELQSLIKH